MSRKKYDFGLDSFIGRLAYALGVDPGDHKAIAEILKKTLPDGREVRLRYSTIGGWTNPVRVPEAETMAFIYDCLNLDDSYYRWLHIGKGEPPPPLERGPDGEYRPPKQKPTVTRKATNKKETPYRGLPANRE